MNTEVFRFLFVLQLLSRVITLNAQDRVFFIGDKTYPSTNVFIVPAENRVSRYCITETNDLSLYLAKDQKKGMIIFESKYGRIHGTILLYLDDNTIIKCYDRNIFDHVDDIYTSVYYLSEAEVSKLSTVNITMIRYNRYDEYGFQSESKTVSNTDYSCATSEYDEKTGMSLPKQQVIERIDFPAVFRNLFY